MAERRMFAKTIIDSDIFIDMPLTTQALYFHLAMRADDDGFVNNPKKIQRMVCCTDDDMRLLIAKQFVIPFDNGICVIRHWKIHNYIRNDRYKPTIYLTEKSMLASDENGLYIEKNIDGIPSDNQNVYQMETQVRLGKDRLDKSKIPPLSPKGGDRANLFETFYSAYPKHQAKKQALKAFEKLNPDDELFAAIMAALENQKQSDQWQRDNGQFIPLPATWLNGRRWEDEPTADGKADKPPTEEYTPEELERIERFKNQ